MVVSICSYRWSLSDLDPEQDDLPHLKAIAQFLIRQRTLKHLKLKFDVSVL